VRSAGRLVGVVFLGFNAASGNEYAKGLFAACPALGSRDVAVAIDHNIDGIDVGLVHGREIGVFHHDDLAVARMLFEIFLDGFFGFADVDGEENEALAGELVADLVDERGFIRTKTAPGGPEFKQDDLAFNGFVVEFFTGSGGGAEAGRGLFVLGAGKGADGGEDQYARNRYTEAASHRHEENVRKSTGYVNYFVGTFGS